MLDAPARLASALGAQHENGPTNRADGRNERPDKTRVAKRHDQTGQQERAPNDSAAQGGPGDSPLGRGSNTSTLTTPSARSGGPARTNHPDSAAGTAMSIDKTIPAPTSRLALRPSQYFRIVSRSPLLECAQRES